MRTLTNGRTDTGAVSGDEKARMRWNTEDFFAHVARKYGVCLLGWPSHLPFANLSCIRGGIHTMRELSSRIECGALQFTTVPPDEVDELTVKSAAPGKFVPRPPRAVRRDYGKQRVLPWLRQSRPPRQMRFGPKSTEFVDDSDAYESEEDEIQSVGSWEAAVDGDEIESASGFDA